jgi:hypothetical protein
MKEIWQIVFYYKNKPYLCGMELEIVINQKKIAVPVKITGTKYSETQTRLVVDASEKYKEICNAQGIRMSVGNAIARAIGIAAREKHAPKLARIIQSGVKSIFIINN